MTRTKKTPVKKGEKTAKTAAKSPAVVKKHVKEKAVKRARRFKPGTVALRQIRKYQGSTGFMLPKRPVQLLIREVARTYCANVRFERDALSALQEAAETYIEECFVDANLCAIHAERVTITPEDLQLGIKIKNGLK